MGKSLNEYMNETQVVDRWKIFIVGLMGAGAGACLMFMIMLLGLSA